MSPTPPQGLSFRHWCKYFVVKSGTNSSSRTSPSALWVSPVVTTWLPIVLRKDLRSPPGYCLDTSITPLLGSRPRSSDSASELTPILVQLAEDDVDLLPLVRLLKRIRLLFDFRASRSITCCIVVSATVISILCLADWPRPSSSRTFWYSFTTEARRRRR